jgi:hypothetical protein
MEGADAPNTRQTDSHYAPWGSSAVEVLLMGRSLSSGRSSSGQASLSIM